MWRVSTYYIRQCLCACLRRNVFLFGECGEVVVHEYA